jgi:hypothetical protein
MSTEPLLMKTQTNATYCFRLRWFTKLLPMPWLCRVLRKIPTWAYRVRPCIMGWRQSEPRLWLRLLLRLLPLQAVHWPTARLPRWATHADTSPDCINCARFQAVASRRASRQVQPDSCVQPDSGGAIHI